MNGNMPAVLVTRPRPASEALAQRLAEAGYVPIVEPLLSIIPTNAPRPVNRGIAAVMITSTNSFAVLQEKKSAVADVLKLPCFCVGPRTAEHARQFGFEQVEYADSDSRALAQLIMQRLHKPAAILHIAGSDTEGTGHAELAAQGYRVSVWPVYKAIAADDLSASTVVLLKTGKIDAIVVFSPRAAQTLADVLVKSELEACCARLSAICLSEAVLKPLKRFNWLQIAAPVVPTEDGLVACLQKVCPVIS